MKPSLNQKGQAAVEYVLLLVLSVAIIVALGSQFFQPMKQWTDLYLGTYITCLLDEGALPGSSVGDCTTTVSASAGAIKFGNGTGSGDGAAAGNGPDSPQAKAAQAGEAARANAANARRRSAHSGRNGGGGGNQFFNQLGKKVQVNSSGTSDTGSDSRESIMSVSGPENDTVRRRRLRQDREVVIKTRGIRGTASEELEKIAKAGEAKSSKIETDSFNTKVKRMTLKPPLPKITLSGDEDGNQFSIGNLFRIGLMVIIILAIVYVVGTQLNSVSKSMDDG